MIMGEDVDQWGIPTKPKVIEQKPAEIKEPPCLVLEDLYLTLKYLAEI